MAPGVRNLGLESPAPEICGILLRAYPELSREEADTCTSAVEVGIGRSELEAGIRRSELEAGTSTSGEEADMCRLEVVADRRTSRVGADRRVSRVEADRCIPADVAGSRFRAVGGLDAARPCSIAVAHRQCMQPAVSVHSSMTSSSRRRIDKEEG